MQDAEKFTEAQKRRLYASCRYIDRHLCEMEQVLDQAYSKSPFPRYSAISLRRKLAQVEEHIRRIRGQLLRTLAREKI